MQRLEAVNKHCEEMLTNARQKEQQAQRLLDSAMLQHQGATAHTQGVGIGGNHPPGHPLDRPTPPHNTHNTPLANLAPMGQQLVGGLRSLFGGGGRGRARTTSSGASGMSLGGRTTSEASGGMGEGGVDMGSLGVAGAGGGAGASVGGAGASAIESSSGVLDAMLAPLMTRSMADAVVPTRAGKTVLAHAGGCYSIAFDRYDRGGVGGVMRGWDGGCGVLYVVLREWYV